MVALREAVGLRPKRIRTASELDCGRSNSSDHFCPSATKSLRFQAPSVGRSLPLAARGTGTRRSELPGSARCGRSPFYEPRAVASVPRTVFGRRTLRMTDTAFNEMDESAVSGAVRGLLATARGSDARGRVADGWPPRPSRPKRRQSRSAQLSVAVPAFTCSSHIFCLRVASLVRLTPA